MNPTPAHEQHDPDALRLLPSPARRVVEALRREVEAHPDDAALRTQLGHLLTLNGRYPEAIDLLKRAIELQPALSQAWLQLGATLTTAGRLIDAATILDGAPAALSSSAQIQKAQGWARLGVRRDHEALECFQRACALQPADLDARVGSARCLARLRRLDEAFAATDALLAEHPDCASALATYALLLFLAGRVAEAWSAAVRAEELDAAQGLPAAVRGLLLQGQGNAAEALVAYEAALVREPGNAVALVGRAQTLETLERFTAALEATQTAARADPANPAVYLLAARLMVRIQRFAEAGECFAEALRHDARNLEALQGRAQCLGAQLRAEEALEAYDRLLALAPDRAYMRGERFYVQLLCCDWTDYEARCEDLALRVRRGERVDSPGSFLAHSDAPADQLRCARIYAADRLVVGERLAPRAARAAPDRVRVAYVSADFHAHATAFLAAGLFEQHDRARFEVIGVSYGRDDGSQMRRRLERAFDQFIDVSDASELQIAQRIADLGVDIAIDLKGHTLGGRPGIFAYRPAPVQVSLLAYPGTMGVEFLDYIVADRHVIPESCRPHYAERIIYLPESYQVNDSARTLLRRPSRIETGLPERGVVFACFNALYKITPTMFAVWMQILQAVPGSVLWLLDDAPTAVRNLRREAALRGVSEGRLIFAPRAKAEHHWARCTLADLFLDTLPYNAHTTASDALRAAVPVLTLAGETFASRVATSLLHAVGLGRLSVASHEQYVKLAVELAHDKAARGRLRAHLEAARSDAPLFDTARYCRHLEDGYSEICTRARRGDPPRDVWVAPRPASLESAAG
jgi:protein O-GlcNAc transferase